MKKRAMQIRYPLLLLSCLLSAHPLLLALSDDSRKAIEIVSDRAEFDDKNSSAHYFGNVVVTQGSLRIEAAELTLKGDKGGVTEVVASGTPARFHQLLDGEEQVPMEGEATSVSYHAKTRLLELKGAAKLRQGERLFFGERIEYQLEKRLVRAFGNSEAVGDGKRVRLILPAPKSDSAP